MGTDVVVLATGKEQESKEVNKHLKNGAKKIIIASNRGEPIVLEDKNCLPGIAFDNTARRLNGETVSFLNLTNPNSKNIVKRVIGNFIKRSSR